MTIEWTIPHNPGMQASVSYSHLHIQIYEQFTETVAGFTAPGQDEGENLLLRTGRLRNAPGNVGIRVSAECVPNAVHLIVRRSDLYIIGFYREANTTLYWFDDVLPAERQYQYLPLPPTNCEQIQYRSAYEIVLAQAGLPNTLTAVDLSYNAQRAAVFNLSDPSIGTNFQQFAQGVLVMALSVSEAARLSPVRRLVGQIYQREHPYTTALSDREEFFIHHWNGYGELLRNNLQNPTKIERKLTLNQVITIWEALFVILIFKVGAHDNSVP